MFSKSLFKQSCKANGMMWCIITFAVCFMLACVMLIAGDGNLVVTKNAIQNTIIKDELQAGIERRAINYYYMGEVALDKFDRTFSSTYTSDATKAKGKKAYDDAISQGKSKLEAKMAEEATIYSSSYGAGFIDVMSYALERIEKFKYPLDSKEAQEIAGLMIVLLNPPTHLVSREQIDNILQNAGITDEKIYEMAHMIKQFDVASFYQDVGEEVPNYDVKTLKSEYDKKQREIYRNEYVVNNCPIFLAANSIVPENIDYALEGLKEFGVTKKHYEDFGFADYKNVKKISISALIDFKANYDYRVAELDTSLTPEQTAIEKEKIVVSLVGEVAQSLLASLPGQVAVALREIGQLDLFGVLVGSIFFKMAGLLLPIIYLIMTSNSLIAGQVDSGSMAYILSSSIKRRTVVVTQAVFLVGSLFAMFVCTSITSVICLAIVNLETILSFGKLLLLNLGAFLVLFAMSGICFLASCWFNRSKRSMAIGGGLNMFFLVASMLGLFGSEMLPSIVRMDALNIFNYVSIISFFDVASILDGTLSFLWKLAILIGVGVVCYFVGSRKFQTKDLPL